MDRTFDAERLDVPNLAERMPAGSALSINTVRKADLKRLKGLDALPLAFLGLRWLSAADLTAIPLPPNLSALRIWHSNKLTSLKGIEVLSSLNSLELRENGILQDATALRDLPKLRHLSIEGGQISRQKIGNLDFLEGLPLTHLSLVAVDGDSLDLGPVARLPDLERLEISGQNFQPEQLAKVAAAHPWFFSQLMDLQECTITGMACKKCGERQKEMFLKDTRGLLCGTCDRETIDLALSGFERSVAAQRVQ